MDVRAISAETTRALRGVVLRPGRPPEDSVYPGDDDPSTVHFGVYQGDRVVGIASLYREHRGGGDGRTPGWRLRGMASEPELRGRGVGRLLLDACLAHVAAAGGGELWCNARAPAVGFYGKAGFEVVSDRFDIPGIGPHVLMARWVDSTRQVEGDG